MNKKEIKELFLNFNIELSEIQEKQFEIYFEFLVEYNQNVNLTAITEKKQVYIKHFLDSVLSKDVLAKNSKVVDIGTGAGFPSLPLKILRPDLDIYMVDSLKKRTIFLELLCKKLDIKANIFHSRAEDFCKNNREKFDYCVSRAVSRLDTLVELSIPLVKVGGSVVAYKGSNAIEELLVADNALKILDTKKENIITFNLPENEGERNILVLKKFGKTKSIYPREKNLPKLKPL